MMRAVIMAVLTAGVATVLPVAAHAQTSAENPFDASYKMQSLAAPPNLAAGALGVEADKIKPVTSLGNLATTLMTGVGPDGKLKGAAGVSFTPYSLGASIPVESYRQNLFSQWFARMGFSAAYSQGETEGSDGSIAVGVQTVFFDRGDSLLRGVRTGEEGPFDSTAPSAVVKCVNSVAVLNDTTPTGQTQTASDTPEALRRAYTACLETLQRASWNDASLGASLVMVSRAKGNALSDVSRSNTVGYITVAYGFEGLGPRDDVWVDAESKTLRSRCEDGFSLSCNAQVLLQAKYQSDAVFEEADGTEISGEVWAYGVKLVVGSERSTGYIFYSEENGEFSSGDRNATEYAIGFETRLNDKLWLNLTAGRRDDDVLGEENKVGASFSWRLLEAASLLNPFASQ